MSTTRVYEVYKKCTDGDDPNLIRAEKERLEDIYKCVCATGEKAKEKYLEKHDPDLVLWIKSGNSGE